MRLSLFLVPSVIFLVPRSPCVCLPAAAPPCHYHHHHTFSHFQHRTFLLSSLIFTSLFLTASLSPSMSLSALYSTFHSLHSPSPFHSLRLHLLVTPTTILLFLSTLPSPCIALYSPLLISFCILVSLLITASSFLCRLPDLTLSLSPPSSFSSYLLPFLLSSYLHHSLLSSPTYPLPRTSSPHLAIFLPCHCPALWLPLSLSISPSLCLSP